MNQGKTVFAQTMSLIPRYEFDKCVKRYNGNRQAIEFKCRDQFVVMSFARKMFHIDQELYILSSVLGKVLFERKPLGELFIKSKRPMNVSLRCRPSFS